MRSETETRALFDHWAQTYDDDLQSPQGPLEGYMQSLQIAADRVPLASQAALLDIGIGTGVFAALLEKAHDSLAISGMDVSPQMLAQCREKHPDYDLREGGFLPLPFDDAVFDAVVSSFAFHETPADRRDAICAELLRVLKPGGSLCLLDIMFASPAAMDDAQRRLGRMWDPTEDYALVGSLDELLRMAGFAGVQWRQSAPCHWIMVARKL